MREPDVNKWSCDDVGAWLKENNFHAYESLLSRRHRVDGTALLALNENDLRQPPLEIKVLGDIKRLYACIRKLQIATHGDKTDHSYRDSVDGTFIHERNSSSTYSSPRHFRRMISSESYSDDDDDDEIIEEEIKRIIDRAGRYSRNLDPEIFKTALSFIYVFAVFLVTSFVMTVVHDRVPDPEKHPPLPDLFLDNIPYMPWAFEVCELVGVSLLGVWSCILIFHKHRYLCFLLHICVNPAEPESSGHGLTC